MKTDKLLTAAKVRLRNGDPLPTDLVARLLEAGIDVSALEQRFSK